MDRVAGQTANLVQLCTDADLHRRSHYAGIRSQTWEVALTTPTRPRSIVFGQWFGRVFLATTLLLSGLPILLSLGTFGGIPLQTVVMGSVGHLNHGAGECCRSPFGSLSPRWASGALCVLLGIGRLAVFDRDRPQSLGHSRSSLSVFTQFSPLLSLEAMLAGTVGSNRAVMTHIMGSLVLTGGLLLAAVLRAALGDSRVSGRTLTRSVQEADDGNPIRWRERLRACHQAFAFGLAGGPRWSRVAGGVARRTRMAKSTEPQDVARVDADRRDLDQRGRRDRLHSRISKLRHRRTGTRHLGLASLDTFATQDLSGRESTLAAGKRGFRCS